MTTDVLVAVWRTTRLRPLWCSGAMGLLVMSTPIAFGARLDFLDATLTLHLALVAMLTGASFVLDDPARSLTEALPVSAKATTALRMGLVLLPVSAFWAAILALAPYTVASSSAYPRGGLVIEAYAVLVWVWTAAALLARRPGGAGGALAAPLLLVGCVVLAMLPDRMAFFLSPGVPGYPESRLRWTVLLLAGLGGLFFATARPVRWR